MGCQNALAGKDILWSETLVSAEFSTISPSGRDQ